jgi:hypothetical protein
MEPFAAAQRTYMGTLPRKALVWPRWLLDSNRRCFDP